MKKLLASVLVLFLVAGCSSNPSAKLSTNEVLFEINGKKVTENDLFNSFKVSDAGSLAIEDAQTVLTKDISEETIATEVAELLEKQKTDLGELFEAQIKSAGYEDEADYIERSLKPFVRLKTLIKGNLNDDYVDFATNYMPKELRIIQLESREAGAEAVEKASAGTSFDEIAEAYAFGTTYDGSQKIYMMNDTKIPAEISKYVLEQNEPAKSGVIETSTGDVKFYMVEVVEPDVTKIKDKAIDAAMQISTLTTKYIAKFYKEAGFKVYDKTIYDLLQKDFKDYIAN